ncbi:MAG: metal ABC transporter ATP-binding protein [Vicinamibacteria bacterium]
MSPAALVARGVTAAIDGRVVLEDVSFEVARGEFCCLCGPNGGGKTTFLKAALGLVPVAGGRRVAPAARPAAAARVGYLPQAKGFNPGFPARVVDMIVANRRGRWPLRVPASSGRRRGGLARVGGERLLDAPLRGLSGGETQRAFLARAIVDEPELLLLDEPTAGVDARGRAEFLDLLAGIAAREDLAAVLVTHNETAVRRLADRVVYLDRSVRAWGPPAEVLAREWERDAFHGHDHEQPRPVACEDEE